MAILRGKTALVTGGGRGKGVHSERLFHQDWGDFEKGKRNPENIALLERCHRDAACPASTVAEPEAEQLAYYAQKVRRLALDSTAEGVLSQRDSSDNDDPLCDDEEPDAHVAPDDAFIQLTIEGWLQSQQRHSSSCRTSCFPYPRG